MDGHASSSAALNQRRSGRNETHPIINDRHLPESHHARQQQQQQQQPRFLSHKEQTSYHTRQNMPTEQSGLSDRFHQPTSPLHQLEALPKLRTSTALHFDYHSRYPSPAPPPETGFPSQPNHPPTFAPQRPMPMIEQTPNHRRAPSPSRHPSPTHHPAAHRTNVSSSGSPMFTLPPLSTVSHRPPTHRAPDQPPNHHHQQQHVDIIPSPTTQRRPSNAQAQRDNVNPEQVPLRRHTLDSAHVPDQQIVSTTGGRKRPSLPLPLYPPQHPPQLRTQPSQTTAPSRPYSSPPPPRRDNPPPSAISPPPPSPSTSHPPQQQQPQSPQSLSQPTIIDGPSPINDTLILETVDIALEPFRLGFENVWGQAVQNVRQVMNKMQKDLTRLIHVERRKNANLMRCLVSNSEKLTSQEWAVEELKKENGSLKEKLVENGQLRRENHQKLTVMDTLSQENEVLRRDNVELKKKNEEMKEALSRAAGFIFQYKEELAKAKVDIETLRKCREPDVLPSSPDDAKLQSTPPTPSSELYLREMTRLHAEKERERIFNDAVKQLRALTALEDSPSSNPQNPDIIRERNSEEAAPLVVNTKTTSTLLDRRVSPTLKQDLSLLLPPPPAAAAAVVADIIHHDPGLSTPSIHHGDKERVDEPDSRGMDLDTDDEDDVMIIPPPMTNIRLTPPNPITKPKSNAEHDNNNNIQTCEPIDEPPRMELESSESDIVEMQRRSQRRQVRRGSTPLPSPTSPPPPARSRKAPARTRMTGAKRGRDEYEENSPTTTEYPIGRVSGSAETEVDGDNNSSEGDSLRERKDDDVLVSKGTKRRKQVVTDGSGGGSGGRRQQMEEIQMAMTPLSNANRAVMKEAHPKASGRWTYYTHYRDNSVPEARPFTTTTTTTTSTSTSLPPSPQDQRPVPPPVPPPPAPPAKRLAKLGINHMDLLYKTEKEKDIMTCRICLSLEQNPELTTTEKRKAKSNTKKFPLNASWADLINHCQTEHAKACEDMEKLSPSQLAEMKQRMPPVTSAR